MRTKKQPSGKTSSKETDSELDLAIKAQARMFKMIATLEDCRIKFKKLNAMTKAQDAITLLQEQCIKVGKTVDGCPRTIFFWMHPVMCNKDLYNRNPDCDLETGPCWFRFFVDEAVDETMRKSK